jgi:hypothetical protein
VGLDVGEGAIRAFVNFAPSLKPSTALPVYATWIAVPEEPKPAERSEGTESCAILKGRMEAASAI